MASCGDVGWEEVSGGADADDAAPPVVAVAVAGLESRLVVLPSLGWLLAAATALSGCLCGVTRQVSTQCCALV